MIPNMREISFCRVSRYGVASIARNNLVASAQNIQGAQVSAKNPNFCCTCIKSDPLSAALPKQCAISLLCTFRGCHPEQGHCVHLHRHAGIRSIHQTDQQDQLNDQDDHSRPQTPRYDVGVIETRLSLYETKIVILKISSSDSGTPPACAGLLLDDSQALWSSSPVDQPGGRDKNYYPRISSSSSYT